jgi:histidinol-phosphate aminotransferase
MININELVRENIKTLKPYSSAREEYRGKEGIFLDANENSLGSVLDDSFLQRTGSWNRYPDPLHSELREKIAGLKELEAKSIFLGNGSDEVIDLPIRAFCEPRIDKIMIMPPTYGMYQVCADINDVQLIKVPLTPEFEIDLPKVQLALKDIKLKLVYMCSPNNPTGNCLDKNKIREILTSFKGLVIIDEAYIDFSSQKSWISELNNFKNLIIMQTFSKVWGLANIRLGMAFADQDIIQILYKIKYPYNINGITQRLATEALGRIKDKEDMRNNMIREKEKLNTELQKLTIVKKVYPSDANFFLVMFHNAKDVYQYLLNNGVIVRDRSQVIHCDNCLRITVGTSEENITLIKLLKAFK